MKTNVMVATINVIIERATLNLMTPSNLKIKDSPTLNYKVMKYVIIVKIEFIYQRLLRTSDKA